MKTPQTYWTIARQVAMQCAKRGVPLDRIKVQLVDTGLLSPDAFALLVEDPHNPPEELPTEPAAESKPETPRLTPGEWPCAHRLEVLRQEGCGCGASKPKMDVFACAVHGECTINSPGKTLRKKDKSGRVAVCISCEQKE